MQRDTAALAACAQACLKAANGHHKRWAVKRCTDALGATGSTPSIAASSARAMARVADAIGRAAAAASQA